MHMLNGFVDTPLFRHLGSSSWHTKDARLILLLKDAQPSLIFVFVVMITAVLALMLWCARLTRTRLSTRDVESHSQNSSFKPLFKYT
jgi:hypothetical protein